MCAFVVIDEHPMLLICLLPSVAFESKSRGMERSDEVYWHLVAYWTPDGLNQRRLSMGWSASGGEICYLQGAVDAMLRHACELGCADASLGF
jgi:hypothetical protein